MCTCTQYMPVVHRRVDLLSSCPTWGLKHCPKIKCHPAVLFPAVAGPVSSVSAPTPTGKGRSRHVSLVGAASGTLLQQPSTAAAGSEASAASIHTASAPAAGGSLLSPRTGGAAAGAAVPATPSTAAAGPGGVFGLIKSWDDDKVGAAVAAASAWY